MHAESEFGFLFDSLADAVTFGVAPSVLMLKSLSLQQGTLLSFLAMIGAMIFSLCGVLRLVRYNVTMAAIKKMQKQKAKKFRHFIGLPLPAAALGVVSTNLLFAYPRFQNWVPMSKEISTIILAAVCLVFGYFMVSRFKFPSAKFLHFRVPSFQLVFCAVVFAFFLLYGVIYFFPYALAAGVWLYILLGWTLILIRFLAGKKSKTLEDFEPHHDD